MSSGRRQRCLRPSQCRSVRVDGDFDRSREAAFVAPVVPIARGWSRQVDTARNPLFYDGPLDADEYEQWLIRALTAALA